MALAEKRAREGGGECTSGDGGRRVGGEKGGRI